MSDLPPTPSAPSVDAAHLDRRARAGRAIRDLGHAVIGHQADDQLLDELVERLDELTARLTDGPPRSREPGTFQRGDDWGAAPDQVVLTGFDDRPVSGRSSPLGLEPLIRREGDEIVAEVTLHSAHEGAPGRSHGGVVAALFDDIYGFVLSLTRTPAFTGELTIRYEAGTPLHEPLTCRVRLAEQVGRKLHMTGELTTAAGQVCVRSRATFIAIDTSRIPGWGDGV
jgi:acyl-coenzyme A thioesterase PaaI-like protein